MRHATLSEERRLTEGWVRDRLSSRGNRRLLLCTIGLCARGCFSGPVYYGAPQLGVGRSFREAVASEEAEITILNRSGQVRVCG